MKKLWQLVDDFTRLRQEEKYEPPRTKPFQENGSTCAACVYGAFVDASRDLRGVVSADVTRKFAQIEEGLRNLMEEVADLKRVKR